MDTAYLVWLGALAAGGVLGLFLKPMTLLWIGAAIFGIAVVGIAVGYQIGQENFGFASGVVAMAVPILGALVVAGAAISRAIFKRGRTK